ncbi:unnamed protein product, partial [Coccothraustes coccothraustes]
AGEAVGPRPGRAMAAAANIGARLSPALLPARAEPGSAGPQEQPRAGPARPRFCHPHPCLPFPLWPHSPLQFLTWHHGKVPWAAGSPYRCCRNCLQAP